MSGDLSAEAEALLPSPDEAPRCADRQRVLGVDPGGSAIDAELLMLVDIPQPWPAKMADHDLLAQVAPETTLAAGRARVVAVVPPSGSTRQRLRLYWRHRAGVSGMGFSFDRRAQFDDLVAELRLVHPNQTRGSDPAVEVPEELVLVCGHGSRDQCCGTDGTRLSMDLRRARPDLAVERTSHLGGHRFSPTALTLPSGRMWADLDLDMMLGILDRSMPASDVTAHCRGWWGALMGGAQMAERAAFASHGWGLDDHERTVHEVDREAGEFEVRWDDRAERYRVRVAREVPTIACRSAGGLPAKPGVEYEVTGVAVGG